MADRDPDLVSKYPDWKRPADWKFPEDWASPAWFRRMTEHSKKLLAMLEQYGFVVCPACNVEHTGKTMTCRGCGHCNKPREDDNVRS